MDSPYSGPSLLIDSVNSSFPHADQEGRVCGMGPVAAAGQEGPVTEGTGPGGSVLIALAVPIGSWVWASLFLAHRFSWCCCPVSWC